MVEGTCSKGDDFFLSFSSPKGTTKAVVEMSGRAMATKPLYVALAQDNQEYQDDFTEQYMQRMATVGDVPNPAINPHQPTFPLGYSITVII